jgi:aminopeptidase N
MNRFLLLAVLFIAATRTFACDTLNCYIPDDASRYKEHNVDFIKMVADIRFEPKLGKVLGRASYDFRPVQPKVDSVFLDAPGISIEKVLLNGAPQKFDSLARGVSVRFAKSLSWNAAYKLEITYTASPRKALYFIGWNDTTGISRKQIYTQGQGIGNSNWVPCYDDLNDKLITETRITFDKAYTVISNGKLLSKTANADSTVTWHYAMSKPHVPYLMMLAIDKYAYKDVVSANGIISRQYYYADRPETFAPTYAYSKEMMDWLPKQTGVPYAWGTYCNVPVQDFMYGAMENTTATIYTDFYLQDARQAVDRNYVATNAHELTHHWFGDLVTEWSASHHWLHESFATYYAKQFTAHVYGKDQYLWNKRGEANQALAADDKDRYPVAHGSAGSARHYPKGSFVIDMLRYVVGDSVFNKSIQYFLKKHAYGNVDTHDFWLAFMETSGVNIDWFLDEWIKHSGYPDYVVTMSSDSAKATFVVHQAQERNESGDLFKMPVDFKVCYSDTSYCTTRRAWVQNEYDTIVVDVLSGKKVACGFFDPESKILKRLTFQQPVEAVKAQVRLADNLLDKYDALLALRTYQVADKRETLNSMIATKKYHPLIAETLHQLKGETDEEYLKALKYAIMHSDVNVRRAALEQIDSIPAALKEDYEKLLKDSSYTIIELALRKLYKQFPNYRDVYLGATKGLTGNSRNVEITWHELNFDNDSLVSKKQLTELTSARYEFRTRIKAIDAIEKLKFSSDEVVSNLIDASFSFNTRLQNPAIAAIKRMMKDTAAKQLFVVKAETGEWLPWQRAILDSYVK